MATYLTRTQTTGDPKKWNISVWIKRTDLTGDNSFSNIIAAPTGDQGVWIASDGQLDIYGAGSVRLKPKAKLRDTSAWYHVVVSYDSTQSTSSDRIKAYINGSQLTDFDTNNYPSLNEDSLFNVNGTVLHVGRRASSAEHFYKGYMSEMIFTDGYNYAPSTFGSTNANGVWVPNVNPSVTYGNNGFRLQFANSGSSADANGFGADTSGNNNHLASNALGTTPSTKDTPQNNFAVINLLSQQPSNPCSITEGGLKAENTSSANTDNNQSRVLGTMFPTTGKWYTEIKYVSGYSATDGSVVVGLASSNVGKATTYSYGFNKNNGNNSHTVGYGNNGKIWYNGSEQTTGLTTFTTGDILGMAMDLTNGKFFVSKNGTFFSNGTGTQDPANGTNPLYSSTNIQNPSDGMTPGIQLYSSPNGVAQFNYGNPSFTISSNSGNGNADANGHGKFEYAVPSGYYALCTKNLAQYG